MNRRRPIAKVLLCLLTLLGTVLPLPSVLAPSAAFAQAEGGPVFGVAEQSIDPTEAPVVVQHAATTAAGNIEFKEALVEIAADGATIYQMIGETSAGRLVEVDVTRCGQVLEFEEEWILAELPTQITAALDVWLPGFEVSRVDRSSRPDGMVYQFDGTDAKGREIAVVSAANGERISVELEGVAGLPPVEIIPRQVFGLAERSMAPTDAPPVIRHVAAAAAGDVQFKEALLEVAAGRPALYQMIGETAAGRSTEVDVTIDGLLWEFEEEWLLRRLPLRVATALNIWLPGFEASRVDRSTSPDGIVYQFDGKDAQGQEIAVVSTASGERLTIELEQPTQGETTPLPVFGVAEQSIDPTEAPVGVRQAATTAAGNIEFKEALIEIAADGATIYQLIGETTAGRSVEVDITSCGQILEFEEEWVLAELPTPITAALADWLPGFEVRQVDRSSRPDGMVYQFNGVDAKGRDIAVVSSANGERLSVELEDVVGLPPVLVIPKPTFGLAERSLEPTNAPPAIRHVAAAAAGDVQFTEALLEVAAGRPAIYQMIGENATGRLVEVDISLGGLIYELEEEWVLQQLPSPIITALADWLPGFEVRQVDRSTRPDGMVYQFDGVDARGRDVAVVSTAGGERLTIELEQPTQAERAPLPVFGVAEQSIDPTEAPMDVRQAATTAAGNIEFKEALIEIAADGATIYQMIGETAAGRSVEVDVSIGGLILEFEEEWVLAELPTPITAALADWLPGFEVRQVDRSSRPDGMVYQFNGVDAKGRDIAVVSSANGERLSVEIEDVVGLPPVLVIPKPTFGLAERSLEPTNAPPAIRHVAAAAAGDVQFTEALLEVAAGRPALYQMIGQNAAGGLVEVDISLGGLIYELEEEWVLQQLPPPIITVLADWLPGFEVSRVDRSTRPDGMVYQFDGTDAKGRDVAVVSTAGGERLTIELEQPTEGEITPLPVFGVAEQSIDPTEAPAYVRQTATTAAGNVEFKEALIEIAADGATIYQLIGDTSAGRSVEVDVSIGGLILEFEEDWILAELPRLVAATLAISLPGFDVSKVDRSSRPDGMVYQFDGTDAKGQELAVVISANGERLNVERDGAVGSPPVGTIPRTNFVVAERSIELADAPASVKNVAEAAASGGNVQFNEAAIEVAAGEPAVYQIIGENAAGRLVEVDVTIGGLIYEFEEEWTLAELPPPIITTLADWLPDFEVSAVDRSTRPDGMVYQFDGTDVNGRAIAFVSSASGEQFTVERGPTKEFFLPYIQR